MTSMTFTTKLNLRSLFLLIVILSLTSITLRNLTLFRQAYETQEENRQAISLLLNYAAQTSNVVGALQQNGETLSQAQAAENPIFEETFGAESPFSQPDQDARIRQLADEVRSQHTALFGTIKQLNQQEDQSVR